jgi:regulator of protease activity HflC (stomatin/prohibitin superfamily)
MLCFWHTAGVLAGYHFTPEQHVTPVLRWEKYHRLEEPGYFRIRLTTEEVLPPVYTGVRAGRFPFNEVMSADNVPFAVQVVVRFRLDPCEAAAEAKPAIVRAPAEGILQTVADRTEQAVRRRAATFRADEINSESAATHIEQHITRYVGAELKGMGVLLAPSAAIVKELSAPAKFQQMMLHMRQQEALFKLFQQYASTGLIDQTIWADFVNRMEGHNSLYTFVSPTTSRHTAAVPPHTPPPHPNGVEAAANHKSG